MKIIFILFTLIVLGQASDQQPFFSVYMSGSPVQISTAEMNQDRFKIWLILNNLSDSEIPLKQGLLQVSKITQVTPLGIKAMTDRGVEIIGWDSVGGEIAQKIGWNDQVQSRYAGQKKANVRDNNSAIAAERLAAVKASNAANADASRSSKAATPALVFETYPADIQATIRRNALLKWPGKYDMQVYEIEKQTQAFATFNSWRKAGIPGLPLNISSQVMKASWDKWGSNFDMVIYHAENETKAWRKLNAR
jgi:hypothetical protein